LRQTCNSNPAPVSRQTLCVFGRRSEPNAVQSQN
jgi:hypothetical protein